MLNDNKTALVVPPKSKKDHCDKCAEAWNTSREFRDGTGGQCTECGVNLANYGTCCYSCPHGCGTWCNGKRMHQWWRIEKRSEVPDE